MNHAEVTTLVPKEPEEFMNFWYSSVKWKDILKADEAETICVPPCHDVLKNWKRDDVNEAPHLSNLITGQRGEAEFLRKFIELKMGGILVCGLDTFDLTASKTLPSDLRKGEWDAIFFHQKRGIFVIEVKATETNEESVVSRKLEVAKTQLDRNIESIKKSFLSLYQMMCTNIVGCICFPFRDEERETYRDYRIIGRSAMNDPVVFRKFFEPQPNRTMIEIRMLQPFAVEFVRCRSNVEFHSQAYNAMKVATWIMEQDMRQKNDSKRLVCLNGNGPSGKIFLTKEQLEIVECREKCITICGAPGSGKTLIVMLRALKAAMENKPGAVFIFVNEKLKKKYEHYFYEEKEKIFVDQNSNIDRKPKVQTIEKISFAQPEDDIFFDETPVEEFHINYIKGRVSCQGSTTVVLTGLYNPAEAVDSFRLYQPQLEGFKNFEMMKVLRGTRNIFEKWEHYFPFGTTMGHSIEGVAVQNRTLQSFKEVQEEIVKSIKSLTLINVANSNVMSLSNNHIAVITSDEEDSIEVRKRLENNGIECGQVDEHARKLRDKPVVAVDVYLSTPSYEWPIVFIILKSSHKKEEILPLAASRCIASLTIFDYGITPIDTSSDSTKRERSDRTN